MLTAALLEIALTIRSMQMNAAVSPPMPLPAELRMQIYEYVLGGNFITIDFHSPVTMDMKPLSVEI